MDRRRTERGKQVIIEKTIKQLGRRAHDAGLPLGWSVPGCLLEVCWGLKDKSRGAIQKVFSAEYLKILGRQDNSKRDRDELKKIEGWKTEAERSKYFRTKIKANTHLINKEFERVCGEDKLL